MFVTPSPWADGGPPEADGVVVGRGLPLTLVLSPEGRGSKVLSLEGRGSNQGRFGCPCSCFQEWVVIPVPILIGIQSRVLLACENTVAPRS